jgi:hypothetical protein
VRPNAIESLRAIQGAIAERLVPELSSLFAQEAAQAASMLVESLAAEADAEAQNLRSDNEALRAVLNGARDALSTIHSNTTAASLVSQVDGVLREAGDGAIAVSSLTSENNRLRAPLEALLEFIEDNAGEPGCEALGRVRQEAYRHLRRVAVRGWSYLDVSGFRERIVKARAELS